MRILSATVFSFAAIAVCVAEPKANSQQTNMGSMKSPLLAAPKVKPATGQLNEPAKLKPAPVSTQSAVKQKTPASPNQVQRKAVLKKEKTNEGSDRASNYELNNRMSEENQAETLKDQVNKRQNKDCVGCKF